MTGQVRFIDQSAHIGLGDIDALIVHISQRDNHRLRFLAGAGIAGDDQATARHFDQHLEGALDHGQVALAGADHSQNASVGQVDKIVLDGGHQINAPFRLLLLLAMIFTLWISPIR